MTCPARPPRVAVPIYVRDALRSHFATKRECLAQLRISEHTYDDARDEGGILRPCVLERIVARLRELGVTCTSE